MDRRKVIERNNLCRIWDVHAFTTAPIKTPFVKGAGNTVAFHSTTRTQACAKMWTI